MGFGRPNQPAPTMTPMDKRSSSTASARRRHAMGILIATSLACLGLGATGASAQPIKLGVEVYALAGGYYFGNESHLLKNRRWAPSYGAGVFIPVLSKWGLLVDGVASRLKVNEGLHGPGTGHPQVWFYESRPDIAANDVTTQQLITIHPSFVRRWQRDRLSFYFGGGFAMERQQQTIRYRPVDYFEEAEREAVVASGAPYVNASEFPFSDETGIYALSEQYVDSKDSVSATGLTVRGGVLVDATKRVIVRLGYSYIIQYLDSPPSQSLEVGIGYRF